MKNIEEINNSKVKQIVAQKKHPEFYPGDIIKVGVKITEGKRDRVQYFEGVCIAKKNRDINSSFTVRKISFGEGVERTFSLYSPAVDTIKVIRSGKVRRAKLYYLRDRTGKSARISEKIKKKIGIDLETKIQEVTDDSSAQSIDENKNEVKKQEVITSNVNKEETKIKTETPKAEAEKKEAKPLEQSKPQKKVKLKEEDLKKEEKK